MRNLEEKIHSIFKFFSLKQCRRCEHWSARAEAGCACCQQVLHCTLLAPPHTSADAAANLFLCDDIHCLGCDFIKQEREDPNKRQNIAKTWALYIWICVATSHWQCSGKSNVLPCSYHPAQLTLLLTEGWESREEYPAVSTHQSTS